MMDTPISKTKKLQQKFLPAAARFVQLSLISLMIMVLLTTFEILYTGFAHQFPPHTAAIFLQAFANDLIFWCKGLIYFFILFLLCDFISPRFARIVYISVTVFMALCQLALSSYFAAALVPLGADLYGYSITDIKQTIGAAGGVNLTAVALFLVFAGGLVAALAILPGKIKLHRFVVILLPVTSFLLLVTDASALMPAGNLKSDYANNLAMNKSDHFYTASYRHFFAPSDEQDIYADSYVNDLDHTLAGHSATVHYVDPANFPFLHRDSVPDVLAPYFAPGKSRPNIVIILVEGLGRAFSGDGAYLGDFTPFIDSLSGRSLYWKNFLSEGGRTFAVLPSVLGSLPFAKNGFLDLDKAMPSHISLLSLLKYNGYHTSFYYGGDARFDNMSTFLNRNAIDELNDEKSFPSGYQKLPASSEGFSWGYNDKELFRHFLSTRPENSGSPQLSVLLTVSTHSPFKLNEEAKYMGRLEQRMTQLGLDEPHKKECRSYELQYASILYMDDALRGFFDAYKKRADYANTIFLITGDHRMPEIPMSDKIDRFHVPLIIYSPMLKRTANFASVSTHFDISPSLLAYLHSNFKATGPTLVSWLGQGLDTARSFRNIHNYPLLQTKTDLVDFIMGDYHLNNDNLFKLNADLGEDPLQDEQQLAKLKMAFEQFKQKNGQVAEGNHIIPDSIFSHYKPRSN